MDFSRNWFIQTTTCRINPSGRGIVQVSLVSLGFPHSLTVTPGEGSRHNEATIPTQWWQQACPSNPAPAYIRPGPLSQTPAGPLDLFRPWCVTQSLDISGVWLENFESIADPHAHTPVGTG